MQTLSQAARRVLEFRAMRLILVGVCLTLAGFLAVPHDDAPLDLSYQLKLAEAGDGVLTIRLTVTGNMPKQLRLLRPTGAFGEGSNKISITPLEAFHPGQNGKPNRPLKITDINGGWQITNAGKRWTTLVYRVDLPQASSIEEDIRHHLTVPMAGGFRGLGFHLFLVPDGPMLHTTTVSFQKTAGQSLIVPWPVTSDTDDNNGIPIYEPAGINDMLNSIIVWCSLRADERDLGFCRLQTVISEDWIFDDRDIISLLSRIARAEAGFFGSAPRPNILCVVARNPVRSSEGFDFYGLHVGQSILLLLDPATSYADLNDKAAAVLAHEMFHAWLGEAIRQEDARMLWFTEGLTTWYTYRMLVRAHIWTPDRASEVMDERVTGHYFENELLGVETLADAAARVMGSAENTRFAYAGGSLAAAALNDYLKTETGDEAPLDELLFHLYAHCQDTPLSRSWVESTCRLLWQIEIGPWLDEYVYGKETLPQPDSLF